jgi:hypothetical protein
MVAEGGSHGIPHSNEIFDIQTDSIMSLQRLPILLITLALLPLGCGESWDIGHSKTLYRNGWNIQLSGISDDSVTQSDWGTTIATGGHTIVIANGVTINGSPVASGTPGNLKVVRGNGTVSVTVNGKSTELN